MGQLEIEVEDPIVVDNFSEIPELGRFVLLKDEEVIANGIITDI